jgi:hypothetical protein
MFLLEHPPFFEPVIQSGERVRASRGAKDPEAVMRTHPVPVLPKGTP